MRLEFVDSTNDWLFGEDVLVTDKSSYSSPFCSLCCSFDVSAIHHSGHFLVELFSLRISLVLLLP